MDRYSISLWNYLKQFKNEKENELTIDDRMEMLEKIIDAVLAIQTKNYCHLDLKPSNILINLDDDGKWNEDLVLTDFGLSGTIDTAAGQCGTPGFGSPEQFLGKVHPKSDNYALAKVAVIILFPWNVAWDLLSKPVSNLQLENENVQELQFYKSIVHLLHVRR